MTPRSLLDAAEGSVGCESQYAVDCRKPYVEQDILHPHNTTMRRAWNSRVMSPLNEGLGRNAVDESVQSSAEEAQLAPPTKKGTLVT